MTRPTTKPRYIKAETIRIGSIIRVTWTLEDVQKSITGKVAHREHFRNETIWITDSRRILLRRDAAMRVYSLEDTLAPTITLITPAPELAAVTLEGMENV